MDDFDLYFISWSDYREICKMFICVKPTSLQQIKQNHKSMIALEVFGAWCNNYLPSSMYGRELRNKGFSRLEIVNFFFELDERRPLNLIAIKEDHTDLILRISDEYKRGGLVNKEWVDYMKKCGLSNAEIVTVFQSKVK